MHANHMHPGRKLLRLYRIVKPSQVLSFSRALSISTVFSLHILIMFLTPRDTYIPFSTVKEPYSLHLQQTLNSFTEHNIAVVERRREIWAKAAALSIEVSERCHGGSRQEGLPHPSIGRTTSPFLWQAEKQLLFIPSPWLGAMSVKKPLSHLKALAD